MRIAKIEKDSLNNGPGVRAVVWCQGCSVKCKGCHNPETWNPSEGREFNLTDMTELVTYLQQDYVSGLTISGGNPLEPYTVDYLICMLSEIRKRCPDKTIWLYTGFDITYQRLIEQNSASECCRLCDVVIDGPYVEELRSITIPFRGSTNQHVIDIQKSLKQKKIVLWEEQ